MKKIIFILFFAVISTYVKAQQPPSMVEMVNPEKFNIMIDTLTGNIANAVLESDSFYISTAHGFIGDYNNYLLFKKVYKTGGFIIKKNLSIPYKLVDTQVPTLLLLDSNKILFISSFSPDIHNCQSMYILCFNTSFDTLWTYTFPTDSIYYPGADIIFDAAINTDSNYIITVCRRDFDNTSSSTPTNPVIIDSSYTYLTKQSKIDGTSLWDTLYQFFPGYSEFYSKRIIKTDDGGVLILSSAHLNGDPNHYSPYYATFVKLNNNLQIEWKKMFRPSSASITEFYCAYDALQLEDSGFFVAGCLSKPGIIRLDKNGNVKWWRRYHYNGGSGVGIEFSNIYKINNNKYVLIGTADSINYEIAFTYMLCIDSTGNEIWHRKLYGGRQKYYFNQNYSSIRTLDGGFLIGGSFYSNFCNLFPNVDTKSYFIKTDSLGCDGCGSCDTLTKLSATFIVNSTDSIYHGSVPVTVSNPHINCKDTLCLGEKILAKFKIANGNDTYKYKVKIYGIYNNGNVSSYDDCPSQLGLELLATIYNVRNNVTYFYLTEPFNNPYKDTLEGLFLYAYYNNDYYDSYEIGANTIDSTFGFFYGLRQFFRIDTTCVVGIPELSIEKANIKLYPNPSSTYITLQSEQLINGNIYIINNLGLVIKEQEIKQENEKTIDIRSLPAGLYLLRYKEQTLRFSVVK